MVRPSRVLPEVTVTCHVCGSRFVVKNREADQGGRRVVLQDPALCPFCGASIKSAPIIDVGTAKSLLLTQMGAPAEKKAYGTARAFLERFTRTEADVDRLLGLALGMDYDRWEQDNAERRRRDAQAGKAEAPFIPKLRALATSGRLAEELGAAAAPVQEAHRREHERHMAIFAERSR